MHSSQIIEMTLDNGEAWKVVLFHQAALVYDALMQRAPSSAEELKAAAGYLAKNRRYIRKNGSDTRENDFSFICFGHVVVFSGRYLKALLTVSAKKRLIHSALIWPTSHPPNGGHRIALYDNAIELGFDRVDAIISEADDVIELNEPSVLELNGLAALDAEEEAVGINRRAADRPEVTPQPVIAFAMEDLRDVHIERVERPAVSVDPGDSLAGSVPAHELDEPRLLTQPAGEREMRAYVIFQAGLLGPTGMWADSLAGGPGVVSGRDQEADNFHDSIDGPAGVGLRRSERLDADNALEWPIIEEVRLDEMSAAFKVPGGGRRARRNEVDLLPLTAAKGLHGHIARANANAAGNDTVLLRQNAVLAAVHAAGLGADLASVRSLR